MPRKEFVCLIESNIYALGRLSDRLKRSPGLLLGYPKQQITVLMRLYLGGAACLKDIALREHITTPNLCVTFRKLEGLGLVRRAIDERDRRNTWYSVTDAGAETARDALVKMRTAIEMMFSGMSDADEAELTAALKTMNKILVKVEKQNA